MKTWDVECDVTGRAYCQVKAKSRDEAIATAEAWDLWELLKWRKSSETIDANEVK